MRPIAIRLLWAEILEYSSGEDLYSFLELTHDSSSNLVPAFQGRGATSGFVASEVNGVSQVPTAIADVQHVHTTGSTTGGTYTLSDGASITAGIAHNASATVINAALAAAAPNALLWTATAGPLSSGIDVVLTAPLGFGPQTPLTLTPTGITGATLSITHPTTGQYGAFVRLNPYTVIGGFVNYEFEYTPPFPTPTPTPTPTPSPGSTAVGVVQVLGPLNPINFLYPAVVVKPTPPAVAGYPVLWLSLGDPAWVTDVRGGALLTTRYPAIRYDPVYDGVYLWVVDGCPCVVPGAGQPGPTPPPVAMTACCPGGSPQRVCLTITSSTCACLNGQYSLVWNADPAFPDQWVGTGPECGGFPSRWRLFCTCGCGTPVFSLLFDCYPTAAADGVGLDATGTSSAIQCNPLSLSGSGLVGTPEIGGCCTAADTFSWAVVPDDGTCAGGGSGSSPTVADACGVCGANTMPVQFTTSLVVTADNCPACTGASTSYLLTYQGTCEWSDQRGSSLCGVNSSYAFMYYNGGMTRWEVLFWGCAIYYCDDVDFDCCLPSVFTFDSGSQCQNSSINSCVWPSTMTLTPVGDCMGSLSPSTPPSSGGGAPGPGYGGCCPGQTLPPSFTANMTGTPAITFTVTWSESLKGWTGSYPGNGAECPDVVVVLIACRDGTWVLQTDKGYVVPANLAVCSPFELVWSDIQSAFGCSGGSHSFVITP